VDDHCLKLVCINVQQAVAVGVTVGVGVGVDGD